jgi:uncharacterized membrane protein
MEFQMINSKSTQGKLTQHPEKILLILGIIIGLLYCVFIPYGAGYDEEAHAVRVFDVSGFNFIPNLSPYAPSEFYTLSYQRRFYQSPAFDQFSKDKFETRIDWNNMSGGSTIATHSPANYLLQAFVAGIGLRLLDAPVLPVVIFIRLIGFAFYLFACYVTIKLLPVGKWIFLVMSFLPMALFQETTITADSYTIAVSFLFIGIVLNVFLREGKQITTKDTWLIALTAMLLGWAKSGTILLLFLLLLLVRHQCTSKTGKWILLGGTLLSIAISAWWMFGVLFHQRILAGTNTFSSQVKLILQDLPGFLLNYITGMVLSIPSYFINWIGSYGYWVGKVPFMVYVLYPLAIIAALFCENRQYSRMKKERIFLFLAGLIGCCGVTLYNFVGFYEPGRFGIDIVGRYFIPFAPLFFLAFCGLIGVKDKARKIFQISTLVLMLGAVSFYSFGIYRTYYTKCAYPLTSDHTCDLPVYKNLNIYNPPSVELKNKADIRQSIVPECDQVKAVQFMAKIVDPSKGDTMKLTITDDQNKTIAKTDFSLSGVDAGRFISIPVEFSGVENKTIWLDLSAGESNSAAARVDLFYRPDGSIYPQGEFLLDGTKQDSDLVFRYTCVFK